MNFVLVEISSLKSRMFLCKYHCHAVGNSLFRVDAAGLENQTHQREIEMISRFSYSVNTSGRLDRNSDVLLRGQHAYDKR